MRDVNRPAQHLVHGYDSFLIRIGFRRGQFSHQQDGLD